VALDQLKAENRTDSVLYVEHFAAAFVGYFPVAMMLAFFCGVRDAICRMLGRPWRREMMARMSPEERMDLTSTWDVPYDLTRAAQFPWPCLSVVVAAMWWAGRQPLPTALCSIFGVLLLSVAFAVNRKNLRAATPVAPPPVAVEVVAVPVAAVPVAAVPVAADEPPAAVVEALPLVVPPN
jgi:hypothetical protein